MSLFDRSKSVEVLQSEQISDLLRRLKEVEETRERERLEHDRKTEQFLATQQDLIHTICLLKGIPFPDVAEDKGNEQTTEVRPVPSIQRLSMPQLIAKREFEARERAINSRKIREQQIRAG